MKNKLSRMKNHMGIKSNADPTSMKEQLEQKQEIPYEREWEALQTKPYWFEDGYTLIREKDYDINHPHGRYLFSDIKQVLEKWQNHQNDHPLSAKGRKLEDLVFFDTETTGLSSGAGNTIFMLGYCRVQSESVKIKQYFLPGPESEVALYHYFLTDIGNLGNLVTYNGKAFDWPQVKTRHTFVRNQVPQLPKFGHFDLLHASRRFWKDVLPSCKLSIVEQEILKFNRIEDTPSYMAPMLYFDFLKEQDPEFVKGIFQHHEWDVLSLMTLYTHLSKVILDCDSDAVLPREKFEVARWYEAIGEREIAMELFNQLKGLGSYEAESSMFSYAKARKQRGEFEIALSAFQKLIGTEAFTYFAAIESSKICEHKLKDYEKALFFSYEALKGSSFLSKSSKEKQKKLIADANQRISRLENKLR
ncbi:ribonuclease H-like domain-containing protein [Halalkalibacter krulwichiae]|nr:ribonuclease H-like domain-containing protein [Halalkalibacter krulwichiae]